MTSRHARARRCNRLGQLRAFAAPYAEREAFVCGPAPFMTMVVEALRELDVPRSRRHREKFVSLGGDPFGDDIAEIEEERSVGVPVHVEMKLDGTTHVFDDWDPGATLREHVESKGVKGTYS
jgi:3-ketosteroid 9alpha-monooxygenase subunit B